MVNEISFVKEERLILNSYIPVVEGLAAYLGPSYEITLHSLENLDHSVIKIMNGFHTGRSEGSPITDLALSMLEKLEEQEGESDHRVYFCKNHNGEPMKSTTIAIRGQHGRVIGLLCINLYLATPILDFVTGILPQTSSVFTAEHFAENSSDAVSQKLAEAKNAVFSNASVLPSMRNKEIIRLLYNWHVFELKSAIDQVAEALNISSHTVYFHLRNLTKKRDSEEVV